MILEFCSPVVEEWAKNLMEENCYFMSQKELARAVKAKFGKNSVIRRRLTPKEWMEHYEYYLKLNIEVNAPKPIIKDFESRLSYWKKRSM